MPEKTSAAEDAESRAVRAETGATELESLVETVGGDGIRRGDGTVSSGSRRLGRKCPTGSSGEKLKNSGTKPREKPGLRRRSWNGTGH